MQGVMVILRFILNPLAHAMEILKVAIKEVDGLE